ncbi:MAG: DUF1501 domain-containing protein [Myxococcaceae bacterium]|nr:DUF1501 domain-containing protein [Myxococcaceae bacterium]
MLLRPNPRLTRREMLRAISICGAGGAATLAPLLSSCRREEDLKLGVDRKALDPNARYLIVISAAGGASIVDSFMAVSQTEAGANAPNVNCFPDADVTAVAGTPFRATRVMSNEIGAIPRPVNANQVPFVTKHKNDMLVVASTGTSVNHVIAQKRSLTGNGAWKGRTLQECVSLQYGSTYPIPNVNMGVSGYLERGSDDELPSYCYAENVTQPSLWPLGLSGNKGFKDAPDAQLIDLARKLRNEKLDPESVFAKTFEKSPRLKRWFDDRGTAQPKLEAADLITRLNVLPDQPPSIPLSEYGLSSAPDAMRVRQAFPNYFGDPFEGQAALAFLLLKNRISVSVTLGPSFNVVLNGSELGQTPLAFDYSHNAHRHTQAFMWNKVLSVIDRLVDLLKTEPLDATSGLSMWDRTLLYVATDFGRTRNRSGGSASFGTGHDMNNGFLMMSPMLKGNTLLGGVDPSTTYTYGFDPETGVADPNKKLSNERDLFAGILHAMGVSTPDSGLPDARAFRRA